MHLVCGKNPKEKPTETVNKAMRKTVWIMVLPEGSSKFTNSSSRVRIVRNWTITHEFWNWNFDFKNAEQFYEEWNRTKMCTHGHSENMDPQSRKKCLGPRVYRWRRRFKCACVQYFIWGLKDEKWTYNLATMKVLLRFLLTFIILFERSTWIFSVTYKSDHYVTTDVYPLHGRMKNFLAWYSWVCIYLRSSLYYLFAVSISNWPSCC
jgi:hypothetical protein